MKTRQDYQFVPDGDHIRILNRHGDEVASVGSPDGQYIARDAAAESIEHASTLGEALAVLLHRWEENERSACRARQDARRLAFGLPTPTLQ
jgi:hypothetical protein